MAARGRSPGVSSIAFGAQPPDLRFAPLMDMDFAIRCPLVRRLRLVSGSCPSARTFASRFLQTPPRGDSPLCALAYPGLEADQFLLALGGRADLASVLEKAPY